MLGGLVALCRVTTRAFAVPLGSTPQAIGALRLGVELCATYWHFMLAVWLVLFAVMMRWTDELIAICRGLLT
jgi:cytochrome c oxidase subunit 3